MGEDHPDHPNQPDTLTTQTLTLTKNFFLLHNFKVGAAFHHTSYLSPRSPIYRWRKISHVEKISDFNKRQMWKNFTFLHIQRNFTFFCIYCVEKAEIPLHVEKFQISPHLSCIEIWNFSTWLNFSPPIYRWSRWQIWGVGEQTAFDPRHQLVKQQQQPSIEEWLLRRKLP